MTISTTTNRVSFAGNGSTTAFATGFKFFANSDLTVVLITDSTGAESTKVLTTDYTVTGAGVATGGTVTMLAAPAVGETLVIVREQPFTQGLDLVENDPFPSQSVEDQLDKIVIMTQQNNSAITRSLQQPDGDTVDIDRLPAKAARASKVLAFDADGDPEALTPNTDAYINLSPFMATVLDDTTAAAARTTLGAGTGDLDNVVGDTSPQLGGALDTNSRAVNFSEGTAVASATTPDIWATDGNTVHVTGTTQIDDFADAPRVGATRRLIFDDALTLTHGSGITLPGSANITTAAGDIAIVYADAVDAFRLEYHKADGTAVAAVSGLPAPDFTSAEQTVTSDTILDVAHGLGAIPTLFTVSLRCKTTNLGYAVGDEVLYSTNFTDSDFGITAYADTTNVSLVQGAAIRVLSQPTFNGDSITNGSWRWVVRAWA